MESHRESNLRDLVHDFQTPGRIVPYSHSFVLAASDNESLSDAEVETRDNIGVEVADDVVEFGGVVCAVEGYVGFKELSVLRDEEHLVLGGGEAH